MRIIPSSTHQTVVVTASVVVSGSGARWQYCSLCRNETSKEEVDDSTYEFFLFWITFFNRIAFIK